MTAKTEAALPYTGDILQLTLDGDPFVIKRAKSSRPDVEDMPWQRVQSTEVEGEAQLSNKDRDLEAWGKLWAQADDSPDEELEGIYKGEFALKMLRVSRALVQERDESAVFVQKSAKRAPRAKGVSGQRRVFFQEDGASEMRSDAIRNRIRAGR